MLTALSNPSPSTSPTILHCFALPFRQGGAAAGTRMTSLPDFAILRSTALYRPALRDVTVFVLFCREIRTSARFICNFLPYSSWMYNQETHI